MRARRRRFAKRRRHAARCDERDFRAVLALDPCGAGRAYMLDARRRGLTCEQMWRECQAHDLEAVGYFGRTAASESVPLPRQAWCAWLLDVLAESPYGVDRWSWVDVRALLRGRA